MILASEIKLYQSATVNNTSSNGGVMGSVELTGSTLFPAAQNQERITGSTTYRKVFEKIDNADNLALTNAYVFIDQYTPGQDYVVLAPATQTDTQGTMSISRWYGAGGATANAGATSITLVQDNTMTLFATGDMAVITDKVNITDETGGIEYFEVGTVAQNANTVTLQIANSYALINTYGSGTRVASTITSPTIATSVTDKVVTSATGGTFDTAWVLLDNIGAVEETYTLTFTNSTNYTLYGTRLGLLGSASISQNMGFNVYLTIHSSAFGGSFQTGDTVVFKTHPAALPLWLRRTIPANSAAYENNTFRIAFVGDTEGF